MFQAFIPPETVHLLKWFWNFFSRTYSFSFMFYPAHLDWMKKTNISSAHSEICSSQQYPRIRLSNSAYAYSSPRTCLDRSANSVLKPGLSQAGMTVYISVHSCVEIGGYILLLSSISFDCRALGETNEQPLSSISSSPAALLPLWKQVISPCSKKQVCSLQKQNRLWLPTAHDLRSYQGLPSSVIPGCLNLKSHKLCKHGLQSS